MPTTPFDYLDLGGGANYGASKAAIPSRQFSALENWYPYSSFIRRRGGVRRVTSGGAWDQNIYGMFPLKKSDGTWALIVGGSSKFGRLDGNSIVDVPFSTGTVIGTGTALWGMFQYKNYLYALRSGGGLLRIGDVASRAGIARPASAMTIAQGAAGALTAGNYITVVTFGNQATNYESNPSDASNTLALGASRKIDYTNIPISSDPFVDFRRIYRTLANQTGVYFFAFQLSDNTTTSYTGEEIVTANLGDTVSFNNGEPPSGLIAGAVFNDRGFVTDGTDLFFSEFLLLEMFGDESFLPVFPDDGHKIRGLLAFGDRLIIGKTNKIHYLVGNTRATFGLHTLSDAHGLMSGHSLHAAEGSLFWYGSGKSVFRSDGTSVKEISTPQVKPILDLIPDELEEQVVGAIFPSLNWYLLSVPQSGETTNRVVIVYNYKYDTWTTFTHPDEAPQFIGNFFNENFGHILYSTFYDGHLYHYNDESYGTDFGTAIDASFTTKADDFGAPGTRKAYDEVWLLIPQVSGGQIRLEALVEELDSAILDRTVSLNVGNSGWKAYKFPTWGRPATEMQLRGTYSGSRQIDLRQIHFEIGLLGRPPLQPV